MPLARRPLARRISSLNIELPPSMTMSPACSNVLSSFTPASVTSPAGNISHTAFGVRSLLTRSATDVAPKAPFPTYPATVCGLRSYTTNSCPLRMQRSVMLPPMRPKPTMPSCMISSPLGYHSLLPLREGTRLRQCLIDRLLQGGYTFGVVKAAQARGDFEVLVQRDR